MLLVGAGLLLVVLLLIAWRRSALYRERLGRTWQWTVPARNRLGVPSVPASIPTLGQPPPSETLAEPSARAFPIKGLSAGLDEVLALQDALRRLAGVTQAYVSPVTALAYVKYLPAAVTPIQLADAIRRAGYGLSDETGWFDWHDRSRRVG